MSKDDGGSAFPALNAMLPTGMSLHNWFAGMASDAGFAHFLQKYMAIAETNDPDFWKQPAWSDAHMAKIAQLEARYRMAVADAMIEAKKRME